VGREAGPHPLRDVEGDLMDELPIYIDPQKTFLNFTFARGHGNILKTEQDLDRYEWIIKTTQPEVIVECGTATSASAAWFARQGLDVITIDMVPRMADRAVITRTWPMLTERITWLVGSTLDVRVRSRVAELVGDRRCMVSLDSDHTQAHVEAEILAYQGFVSSGCYLVVEDGIFRYAEPQQWHMWHFGDPSKGNPLDAIESTLVGHPDFDRDTSIEMMHDISHHPGGFWRRK
jgi:cephalosporin hydroxylase